MPKLPYLLANHGLRADRVDLQVTFGGNVAIGAPMSGDTTRTAKKARAHCRKVFRGLSWSS